MVSFINESAEDQVFLDRECREREEQPRPVGQFMAAVLAQYGIAPKAETERPRLPKVECQNATLGDLLAVG